jgi:hypothetical protein
LMVTSALTNVFEAFQLRIALAVITT